MANASDVVRALHALHSAKAEQIARQPTGIEPGFDASTGITWTEDGRARYRTAPAGFGGTVISSGALLIGGTPTTVPSDDTAAMVFTSGDVEFDDAGYWDSGQPTRLTVPTTGHYFIAASGQLQLDGPDAAGLTITCHTDTPGLSGQIGYVAVEASWGIGGAGYDAGYGPAYVILNCAGIVSLSAGQYVEIIGDNGNDVGAPDATLYNCIFSIAKL
jgi:hypothetical protein